MNDQPIEQEGLKRVARALRVREIRQRCYKLRDRTDGIAGWSQPEKDRWDLLRLLDRLQEDLNQAETIARQMDRRLREEYGDEPIPGAFRASFLARADEL